MSSVNATAPDVPRTRPGRPPALSESERRQRIIDAAEQVFTQAGYHAATMEEVARIAGMSKKTVYALFADKRQLLADVVSDTLSFTAHVKRLSADRAPSTDPMDDMRHRLVTMLEFVLAPRQVRMARLLIGEAEQAPELAERLHKSVMRKGCEYLMDGLRNLERSGVRAATDLDHESMAHMLLGAAMGDMHICALFGLPPRVTRDQMLVRIDTVLALVFGPAGSATSAAHPETRPPHHRE